MAHNDERLAAIVAKFVDNQIRDENPPETRATFERLVRSGYLPEEALRLISCVVRNEVCEMLRARTEFNLPRFVSALEKLPHIAWDN